MVLGMDLEICSPYRKNALISGSFDFSNSSSVPSMYISPSESITMRLAVARAHSMSCVMIIDEVLYIF